MHNGEDSTAERDVCLSMHKVLSLSFQEVLDHIASKIYMSFASNSSKGWYALLMNLSSLICVDYHLCKVLVSNYPKVFIHISPMRFFSTGWKFQREEWAQFYSVLDSCAVYGTLQQFHLQSKFPYHHVSSVIIIWYGVVHVFLPWEALQFGVGCCAEQQIQA